MGSLFAAICFGTSDIFRKDGTTKESEVALIKKLTGK